MADEPNLEARIQELEGQVEALHHSLVTLVTLLGPDIRDRLSELVPMLSGRIALTGIQANVALEEALFRVGDDLREPLIGDDD